MSKKVKLYNLNNGSDHCPVQLSQYKLNTINKKWFDFKLNFVCTGLRSAATIMAHFITAIATLSE